MAETILWREPWARACLLLQYHGMGEWGRSFLTSICNIFTFVCLRCCCFSRDREKVKTAAGIPNRISRELSETTGKSGKIA